MDKFVVGTRKAVHAWEKGGFFHKPNGFDPIHTKKFLDICLPGSRLTYKAETLLSKSQSALVTLMAYIEKDPYNRQHSDIAVDCGKEVMQVSMRHGGKPYIYSSRDQILFEQNTMFKHMESATDKKMFLIAIEHFASIKPLVFGRSKQPASMFAFYERIKWLAGQMKPGTKFVIAGTGGNLNGYKKICELFGGDFVCVTTPEQLKNLPKGTIVYSDDKLVLEPKKFKVILRADDPNLVLFERS
jgi:hypothetical protein